MRDDDASARIDDGLIPRKLLDALRELVDPRLAALDGFGLIVDDQHRLAEIAELLYL